MADPLFQGMTRPAMLAGVTYAGLILNLMVVTPLFVAFNALPLLLLALPTHGLMWLVCRWDPRFFDLLFVWARTAGAARQRWLWRGSSYRP